MSLLERRGKYYYTHIGRAMLKRYYIYNTLSKDLPPQKGQHIKGSGPTPLTSWGLGAGLTPKDFPVEHSVIGRVGYKP
jgi:hypothetical protein